MIHAQSRASGGHFGILTTWCGSMVIR